MLLLILSLFSHYDFVSCSNNEKVSGNFDESLLMKRHHQNFLQIKDFIKEAQHKFHEERSVLRVGDNRLESARDNKLLDYGTTNQWWEKTSSINLLGLNTPQTFLLPSTRSRPSFPFSFPSSITPYTTEFSNRHVKWDEIFPARSFYTRPSESGLSTDPDMSMPPKNPSIPEPPLKSLRIGPETNNEKPGPTIQPSKLDKFAKPLDLQTIFLPNTSLRSHSGQPFGSTTTIITLNDEYKNIWLREITTYTPVERWFNSFPIQTEKTTTYDYTATEASQVSRTITNAQSSTQSSQLKNDSKDQPSLDLHQGIPVSESPTEFDDTKLAQLSIKEMAEFLNLRTALEKNEERSKMINEGPATVSNDGDVKGPPTTEGEVIHVEQYPEARKQSSNRSRRFHSKVRKKIHQRHPHKRHRARHRHQKQQYRYPEYSNGHLFLRQQEKETTEDGNKFSIIRRKQRFEDSRPTENRKHKDTIHSTNEMLQFNSDHYDTEDEKLINLIERDESVKRAAPKYEKSFYHQVKESLKQVASKRKAKRLKLKDELLRKIVDGSSYSDEEASLTRNLIKALQHGNSSDDPGAYSLSPSTKIRIHPKTVRHFGMSPIPD